MSDFAKFVDWYDSKIREEERDRDDRPAERMLIERLRKHGIIAEMIYRWDGVGWNLRRVRAKDALKAAYPTGLSSKNGRWPSSLIERIYSNPNEDLSFSNDDAAALEEQILRDFNIKS